MLIPLLYIELGRPRDFIKAGLNLFISMVLLIKHDVFDTLYFLTLIIIITILFNFYLLELFTVRWNQLTNQEKTNLKSILELKKNLSIFSEAISLARKDVLNSNNIFKFGRKNKNLNIKKWVRNDENDNMITSNENNSLNLKMQKKATNQFKKDTINEKKNN